MRFIGTIAVLGVISLGYWIWDGSHHDHDSPHGTPVTALVIEEGVLGTWSDDEDGGDMVVERATCAPGEEGDEPRAEPNVHFRCDLTLGDGSHRSRVIHLLAGNELMMRD